MVATYKFGWYGNAASIRDACDVFGIAEGTLQLYTNRYVVAILSLEASIVRWPSLEEH